MKNHMNLESVVCITQVKTKILAQMLAKAIANKDLLLFSFILKKK